MATEVGIFLKGNEKKDAIHMALAPVVAGDTLMPGEPVALNKDGSVSMSTNPIGIVDPFLKEVIQKGEKIWLFLYPNTITSLRHDWEHPSFSGESFEKNEGTKFESKKWLMEFAGQSGLSYNKLLNAAKDYTETGQYLHGGEDFEGFYVPEEFWDHYENVMGIKVEESKKENFFTCAC